MNYGRVVKVTTGDETFLYIVAEEDAGKAAAILAASGFDTSGMRQSVGTLQKDVRIVLDVARGRHASEPASIVELAQRTLRTLAPNA